MIIKIGNVFIYKISNSVNNKVYIGQTIRSIEQRFKRHINDALNGKLDTHLARAIRTYGKNAFEIEQIDSAESQEELNLKEQYWIRYYNSVKEGYNEVDSITKCGGNTYNSKTIDEMKEIKEKISESKVGSLNPNAHKVRCYNIKTFEELIFNTVKECQEYFGEKTYRFITSRAKGNTKSLYKKEWKIAYYEDDYGDYTIGVKRSKINFEVKDTKNGDVIYYNSIFEISKKTGIDRHKIGECLSKGVDFVIKDFEFKII